MAQPVSRDSNTNNNNNNNNTLLEMKLNKVYFNEHQQEE
jgi:hypothetical protein